MKHLIAVNNASIFNRKPICGIGINDADYMVSPTVDGKKEYCPFYEKWRSMIRRCYDKKLHARHSAYSECSVDPEWHKFTSFKGWMESQDWIGKELDKDILVPGNKIYSKDNCALVTHALNLLIVDQVASRGKYPKGVYFDKNRGKFMSMVGVDGYPKYLGRFDTPEEASVAYNAAKRVEMKRVVRRDSSDARLIGAIDRLADSLIGS